MTDPTQQVVRGRLGDAEPPPQESRRPPDEEESGPRHADPASPDEELTSELPVVPTEEPPARNRLALRRGRGLKPGSRLRGVANATTGTWIGVVLVAAGFGVIFFTWGEVAGVLNVAQQLPYIVSGGIAGLALVIVGVMIVDVAVRAQDGYERRQQLAQMNRTLAELRELFAGYEESASGGDAGERNWEG